MVRWVNLPVEFNTAVSHVEQSPVLFELPRGLLGMGGFNAVRGRIVLGSGLFNNSFDVDSGPSFNMLRLLLSKLSILGCTILNTLGKCLHEAVCFVLLDHAFPEALEGLQFVVACLMQQI